MNDGSKERDDQGQLQFNHIWDALGHEAHHLHYNMLGIPRLHLS